MAYKETETTSKTIIICDGCGAEEPQCSDCGCEFDDCDTIYCGGYHSHLCYECKNKDEEDD